MIFSLKVNWPITQKSQPKPNSTLIWLKKIQKSIVGQRQVKSDCRDLGWPTLQHRVAIDGRRDGSCLADTNPCCLGPIQKNHIKFNFHLIRYFRQFIFLIIIIYTQFSWLSNIENYLHFLTKSLEKVILQLLKLLLRKSFTLIKKYIFIFSWRFGSIRLHNPKIQLQVLLTT